MAVEQGPQDRSLWNPIWQLSRGPKTDPRGTPYGSGAGALKSTPVEPHTWSRGLKTDPCGTPYGSGAGALRQTPVEPHTWSRGPKTDPCGTPYGSGAGALRQTPVEPHMAWSRGPKIDPCGTPYGSGAGALRQTPVEPHTAVEQGPEIDPCGTPYGSGAGALKFTPVGPHTAVEQSWILKFQGSHSCCSLTTKDVLVCVVETVLELRDSILTPQSQVNNIKNIPVSVGSTTGRHSLWALATYISGSTPFPEFSGVLMLDDIQVGYFDSVTDRFRENGEEGAELDLGQQAGYIQQEMFCNMKKRLALVKQRFNLTAGVHVQQRLTGCEVLQDGQPALIMFRDGSNGQDADSLMYNMTHFTYASGDSWEIQWDTMEQTYIRTLYSNIYLPFCVRTLKHLLDQNKRLVKRRVQPRVRFITKPLSGGARVTCLATDFYPRHINLTLLRDGQPVDEDQLTGGEVLPNGNGLYQVRKTLTVTDEELQRKHSYTCTTAHLSLDNRLEVSWRAEFSRSHRVHIISAPASLAIAAVLLLLLLWWRKRRRTLRSEGIAVETQEQPGEE
ncbi:uncharacterized protein LOC128366991 [Scomber japonicus]|uniref:uncharacterized protein LOC128366991 n=1 Tax=Scomber japonicus TaxID=13676 RepID=UPI002304E61F|nr:uncharacterized protein LOC128366991 [Scomber japonicus]